jgi:hypothetical protein
VIYFAKIIDFISETLNQHFNILTAFENKVTKTLLAPIISLMEVSRFFFVEISETEDSILVTSFRKT